MQAAENAAHAVEDKTDGRVATLYGVQAGLAIANGIQGIQTVTSGGVSQTAAIKVTASVGGGSQNSESHSPASTNQGTTVKAGNAVTIVATGSGQKNADGFATDGNISRRGAQIEGKTVTLSATRDVNLESTHDRSSLDSRSLGSNASVGVCLGLGGDQNGFTLELAASQNKVKPNGEAVTNHNSHVVGTDKVTVVSGRDTNLKGAQLIGNTVEGTVGRDLNIESRPEAGGAAASLAMEAFGQALLDQRDLSEGDRKALVQLPGAIVGGAAAAGGSLSDAAAGASIGKVATRTTTSTNTQKKDRAEAMLPVRMMRE